MDWGDICATYLSPGEVSNSSFTSGFTEGVATSVQHNCLLGWCQGPHLPDVLYGLRRHLCNTIVLISYLANSTGGAGFPENGLVKYTRGADMHKNQYQLYEEFLRWPFFMDQFLHGLI